jgi:mannose-6-phosphate isomerase-like protein (cupin superfamily)
VVISGVATCTIDDEVMVVGPGESVDVAQGAKHRLANEGSEELVIVEVQRGAYTGEDDIVRLEDDFGRLETP